MLRVPSQAVPLTAATAVAVLSLGSVTQHGLLAAGIATALAAIYTAFGPARAADSRSVRLLLVAGWSLVGWQLIQLIPLPPKLLRIVTPRAAEIWSAADGLLGRSGAWHPISVDPPGAYNGLATTVLLMMTFVGAARVARGRDGRRAIIEGVALVTQLFAVVTLAHVLFGLTRVFGWYAPRGAGYPLVGPVLNPNHAAAIAAVGPPVLLGLASRRESTGGKLIAWLGVALTAIVAVLTLSRGGIAVLVAEFVAMAMILSGGRRTPMVSRVAPLVIAGIVLMVAGYIARDPLVRELRNTDYSKVRLAQAGYAMALEFPLVGAGRGAFGALSGAYAAHLGGLDRYSYAEHWPAQLAVELGIPAALAVCIVGACAVLPNVRHALRAPHTAGALVALAGLLTHDLADFAMAFAGTGMIAASLLAVVVSEHRHDPASRAREPRRSRTLWFQLGGAAIFVASLSSSWDKTLEETTSAVSSIGRSPAGATAARSAMALHPAESFFPMLVGSSLGGSGDAAGFLAHAIVLAPGRPAPHFWMARWFWAVGRRAQAYGEYREAARLQGEVWLVVADELLRLNAPLSELSALATKADHLELLAVRLIAAGRSDDAVALDERMLAEFPEAPGAYGREIARAQARGDIARARRVAERWLAASPNSPAAHAVLAGILPAHEAERMLNDALARLGEDPDLVAAWLRVRAAGTEELGVHDIDRLRNALLAHGRSVHIAYGVLGEIAISKNRNALALRHFRAAAAASPDGLAYLEQAAMVAEKLGDWAGAADAWDKLALAHPQDARFAKSATIARGNANAPAGIAHPP